MRAPQGRMNSAKHRLHHPHDTTEVVRKGRLRDPWLRSKESTWSSSGVLSQSTSRTVPFSPQYIACSRVGVDREWAFGSVVLGRGRGRRLGAVAARRRMCRRRARWSARNRVCTSRPRTAAARRAGGRARGASRFGLEGADDARAAPQARRRPPFRDAFRGERPAAGRRAPGRSVVEGSGDPFFVDQNRRPC